ncbi:MAG: tetratricopeptide repeat protein, partial [Candidatus Omnitrophica bacterium]|nr:tetratricopeptide repeat protein [Candidatus Omnitrophota bacterium]
MINKIFLNIIFTVLLFATGSACLQAEEVSVRSELDFVKKAVKDGFCDLAEGKLNMLLNLNISRTMQAEAHFLRGRVYYERGLPAKAIAEFNIVMERFNDSECTEHAVYWIAEVYFKEGNYEQALVFYNLLIKNFPASEYVPYSVYSEAWCYEKLGEYAMAVEMFDEVCRKYSRTDLAVKASYQSAELLSRTNDYKKAVAVLEDFLDKYPVNERVFDAYYLLGDCFYKLEDYNRAVENFVNAMNSTSNNPWKALAEYKIAKAYLCQGKSDLSEKYFEKAAAESDD